MFVPKRRPDMDYVLPAALQEYFIGNITPKCHEPRSLPPPRFVEKLERQGLRVCFLACSPKKHLLITRTPLQRHTRALDFEGPPWVLRKACPSHPDRCTSWVRLDLFSPLFRLQSGANAHSKRGKGQCHSNARRNQRQISLQILLDLRRMNTG